MADQYTPTPVKGLGTNNSAAPTNNNVSVMPAVATGSAPSYTEGNEVKQSVDLNGAGRVTLLDANGNSIGTDANPLVVQTDPNPATTDVLEAVSSVNLASGASVTLDGASITDAVEGRFKQITVSSSVRVKAVIESFDGTTATTLAVIFVDANEFGVWSPGGIVAQTGNPGGTALFRVTLTNMDNFFAADVYATIEHEEV